MLSSRSSLLCPKSTEAPRRCARVGVPAALRWYSAAAAAASAAAADCRFCNRVGLAAHELSAQAAAPGSSSSSPQAGRPRSGGQKACPLVTRSKIRQPLAGRCLSALKCAREHAPCLLVQRIQVEVGGGHQALPPGGVPHQHPAVRLLKHLDLHPGGMQGVWREWGTAWAQHSWRGKGNVVPLSKGPRWRVHAESELPHTPCCDEWPLLPCTRGPQHPPCRPQTPKAPPAGCSRPQRCAVPCRCQSPLPCRPHCPAAPAGLALPLRRQQTSRCWPRLQRHLAKQLPCLPSPRRLALQRRSAAWLLRLTVQSQGSRSPHPRRLWSSLQRRCRWLKPRSPTGRGWAGPGRHRQTAADQSPGQREWSNKSDR